MSRKCVVPDDVRLSCDACSSPNKYYAPALLMYAGGVTSPNTFWWWHFPVDCKKDIPVRCNAHHLLENQLVEHVRSMHTKEDDNVAKGL